jgi:hypothetical protein
MSQPGSMFEPHEPSIGALERTPVRCAEEPVWRIGVHAVPTGGASAWEMPRDETQVRGSGQPSTVGVHALG